MNIQVGYIVIVSLSLLSEPEGVRIIKLNISSSSLRLHDQPRQVMAAIYVIFNVNTYRIRKEQPPIHRFHLLVPIRPKRHNQF